jgi:hypothetical protein
MINGKYLVIIMLIIGWTVNGQSHDQGRLSINADPRIDSLVQLHIAYNEVFSVMPGYRIQIFMKSGNEALSTAEEVKVTFSEQYTDIPAYLIFAAPYYRVRVGDFRTRLQAEKFLQEINRKYPNAWVIKDDINFPKLTNYQKSYDYE